MADVKNVMSIDETGAYKRKASVFRNFISKAAPPASEKGALHFPPAAGRYRLYYSFACPWACRVLAFIAAKGLTKAFDLVCVHPIFTVTMPEVDDDESWVFDTKGEHPLTRPDPLGHPSLRHLYLTAIKNMGLPANSDFNDTVPLLFDTQTNTIVNNESSEIIRMINNDFNEFPEHPEVDLCPKELLPQIDAMNESVYESVLTGWMRDVYQTLNLKETVNFHHIRTHYFCSHPWINPYRIVPISCGVEETLSLPHGRERL